MVRILGPQVSPPQWCRRTLAITAAVGDMILNLQGKAGDCGAITTSQIPVAGGCISFIKDVSYVGDAWQVHVGTFQFPSYDMCSFRIKVVSYDSDTGGAGTW